MLGLRTEMGGVQPFLDPWVKKQNLLPLIKEKGEFVAQQMKTGKQGEQENREQGTTGTGEPGNNENRETKGGEVVISFINS